MKEFLIPFLLSTATGILSGWGVGGGTLLLLCLTLFLGVEARVAQAVNLLVFLPAAALSLWFHRKNSRIAPALCLRCALPGTAATFLAALAAMTLDASLLRKPFGLFLLYCAITMLRPSPKN